jgi:hypothetical protein
MYKFNPQILATLAIVAMLMMPTLALGADNQHPGYVDFDNLPGLGNADATVDITLGGWLMGLARIAAEEEDDLDFLNGIDSIRVRVFEIDDNADVFLDDARQIMEDLEQRGWEQFARVNKRDELVFIMVKGDERQLDGITIVAVESGDEAVFVNISGSIDPDDIAKIISDSELIHADIQIGS